MPMLALSLLPTVTILHTRVLIVPITNLVETQSGQINCIFCSSECPTLLAQGFRRGYIEGWMDRQVFPEEVPPLVSHPELGIRGRAGKGWNCCGQVKRIG
jgi:hypothetical protein